LQSKQDYNRITEVTVLPPHLIIETKIILGSLLI
jgi:arginine exporter protein ArgO